MISKAITLLLVLTISSSQQQQSAAPIPNFDWNTLKTLIMQDCDNGLNSDAVLTNVTQYSLPSSSLQAVLTINSIPWASWYSLQSTPTLGNWDVGTLQTWIQNYIQYHNTVAALFPNNIAQQQRAAQGNVLFLGAQGGPIANTFGLGNNAPPAVDLSQPTPIDQNLTLNNVWDPSYNALPFQSVIQSLQIKAPHVLYESLSFFTLFFGVDGIVQLAGLNGIAASQSTANPGFILAGQNSASQLLLTYQSIDTGIKNLATQIQFSGIAGVVGTNGVNTGDAFAAVQAFLIAQYQSQFVQDCNCTSNVNNSAT